MQKFRVYTDIGKDQKLTVELNQDFDLLEILSLKFSQQQIYSSFCADYGVVVGRVTANNGYGVPNARVSIFIPLSTNDENDPVISALYPYKSIEQKNEEGYRYNLLPSRKQHGGHTPTGTFPDQLDIISREEVLEVFEKYYKYTVKTNSSGDFMIWGVPIGPQTLHIDVDLSDMGCFSLRPDDFIRLGYGVDQFETSYSFKSSNDLDSLPQIVSFRKTIEVYPFWGNEDLCQIGITRSDFDLSDAGINIQPFAYLIGGTFTDSGKNTINKNCKPRRKMGRKCNLTTQLGIIETIRFTIKKDVTNLPILETLPSYEDIGEDGAFLFPIEMNMDYLITNEFGENEYVNDPNKGIPTSAVCRFRFSLKDDNLGRIRTTGKYLVPNIKEYTNDVLKSYSWSLNFNDYPTQAISGITRTIDGFYYPEDYFYRLTYNKVYTVSSFQNSHFQNAFFPKDDFLAIKEILPPEEEDCSDSVNTFPVNFGIRNYTFNLLIAEILLFVEHILNIVKIGFMNAASRALIRFGCRIDGRPLRKVAGALKGIGFDIMEGGQKKLYLINYPECEECIDDELTSYPSDNTGASQPGQYCDAGTFNLFASSVFSDTINFNSNDLSFSPSTSGDCASCSDPLLNVDSSRRSDTYFTSGLTNTAWFILNQSHYIIQDGDDQYNLFQRNTYQPYITGTPVYHTCYTYDFSAYAGITDLDLVYNGVSYDIPDPISTSDFFTNFPANSFGPSGATLTITSSSSFTVCPNINRQFGNLTVTHSTGTDTVTPTIVANTSIIIDYTNLYFINTDYDFYGIKTYNFKIKYKYTDTLGQTTTNCLVTPASSITVPIEVGCELYDTPYNEEICSYYITNLGSTPNPDINGFAHYRGIQDEAVRFYSPANGRAGCTNIYGTIISDVTSSWDYCDSSLNDDLSYSNVDGQRVYPLPKYWNGDYRIKQTISGVSEFKNGIFYIVPGSQTMRRLLAILREYRVRKRVGKMFCGGVVNYSFMDNWLSGSLYFFPFKAKFKRNGSRIKYCDKLIRYNSNDGEFYYRSCPYNPTNDQYGFLTTITKLTNGSVTTNSNRKIYHPTTIVDLGPRDEFIKEICIDPAMDPNCSVSRAIGPSSFQNFGELLGLAINYKLDVFDWPNNPRFNLESFFKNDGFSNVGGFNRVLNGDILQLISINNEIGISEFDLQSPKYLAYSYQFLDPECEPNVFKNGTSVWGPLPITLDMEEDGVRQRLCINQPTHIDYDGRYVQGRLTESAQVVPFFLWDKKGVGFGPYNDSTKDDQAWDYSDVVTQPLQGMTFAYNITGVPNVAADRYLLLPITYTFSGVTLSTGGNVVNEIPFEAVSTSDIHSNFNDQYPGFQFLHIINGTIQNPVDGVLYTRVGPAGNDGIVGWYSQPWDNVINDATIKRTQDYYTGNKQILSTPFLFYFGLRPGKTGLDKLIEKFGPTGAFVNQD